ncbi:MAG: hypothetical protein H6865_06050 [Rhodospirillales bacterium]|nr:hypothetical protein [Alphaproteobacteria bacterium]MCB9987184.1 hypothetical protein [Rhodospirillales bacterium]USO07953.1 MAG: hypothetical protein H6866_01650 [Rhodospirillales bacterium]
MIRHLAFVCVAVGFLSAPTITWAGDGTTPAAHPIGAHKSVRDMTPEQRQAYWDNLPAVEKEKILARRHEIEAERLKKTDPSDPTPGENAAAQNAQALAIWKAMTPDQKRAFLSAHKAEVENLLQPQTAP